MKHIVILIACAMLSACKDEPKVQTWKMAPESEWTTGNEIPLAYSNYVYSNYVHPKAQTWKMAPESEWTATNEVGGTHPVQWNTNPFPVYAVFIGKGPTNIVISNDYSGTIQIGTNFLRVEDIKQMEWRLNALRKVLPRETNAP